MATANPTTPPATRREPFPRPWTPDEFARMQQLGLFPGRAITLDGGRVVEHVPGDPAPRPVTFTRSDYRTLYNANLFRGQRVQLIGGVIVQESPMNPPHADALSRASAVMYRTFVSGFVIRIQMPFDVNQTTVPEPDILVVSGVFDDFSQGHPTRADLVVEVAESSYDEDTTTKASLYAAGGIADYWVIDLINYRVVILRDPAPAPAEPFGHTYTRVAAYTLGQSVTPLAAPAARIAVDDLLP